MGPDLLKFEPVIQGFRPERRLHAEKLIDRLYRRFTGLFHPGQGAGQSGAAKRFIRHIDGQAEMLAGFDATKMQQHLSEIRFRLRKEGLHDDVVADAFAVIREVAGREIGQRHYSTQLIGGWLLLKGMVTEMPTGEGKTLTATLTAGTAAMAGLPVHVLTVNDYLTGRDAQEMSPIYQALGLSVGVVVHGASDDERTRAYAKEVVYCTGKEVVFDYLRDRIVLGARRRPLQHQVEPIFGAAGCQQKLLMRGLHFAIVDEADSILIDEARTPLIISSSSGNEYEHEFLSQALAIAEGMEADVDYKMLLAERRIAITAQGEERIVQLTQSFGPLWSGKVRREAVVSQALSALHLFHRDKHYLVSEGKVEIIDQLTGRVSEGRSWERGLHQLIELKEEVELSQQQATMARISYQSFFQRYLHLSGMTGTAREVRKELWQVYKLPVASIPHYRPSIRKTFKTSLFPDSDSKWRAIAERSKAMIEEGRSILIGTSSVAASEAARVILEKEGLELMLLNAKQDKDEADIIAKAGQVGRITIATSMAGRGTDIKLAESVRQQGGLHVILSERFDAARVDRQLAGRCGRQGDAGSFEAMLSPSDVVFTNRISSWISRMAILQGVRQGVGRLLALFAIRWEQRGRERRSYRERVVTQKYDQQQNELLSISGHAE